MPLIGQPDLLNITPVNPQPVQWYETGVPGYFYARPLVVGAVLAAVGHFTGHRWLLWSGLGLAAYGGAKELRAHKVI